MKKLYVILFSVAFFLTQNLNSQSLGIRSSGLINFPDTITENYSINFSLYVKNTGSLPFSGSFFIQYSVNSNIQPGYLYSGSLGNLMAGDSTLVPINNFYFYNTIFNRNAHNVVVVWPKTTLSVPTTDSSYNVVFVEDTLQNKEFITQLGEKNSISLPPSLFPNPAGETISILNILPENIRQIELIEPMTGKVLRRFTTTTVSLDNIILGYYYLAVIQKDGKRNYLKFIKT